LKPPACQAEIAEERPVMENNTDLDFRRFLRSTSTAMEADEALRARPGALIGISAAAESALATIEINSIFDLAVSRVFAAAARLLAIEQDPTAVEALLNIVASDVAQTLPGVPARELANQPIAILRAIGEAAGPSLAEALDVATVRDLAVWPPYHAAKAILSAAFFSGQGPEFDPEAPADLLPKSGVYPTERIFFKKLVIDAVPEPAEGTEPIEKAPPIDLASALAAPAGFGRLATGALLTFSQSWFAQGLTLGQLLHSASLAPGESTRIAVVDWSRRSRAAASEDISESELLSNTMSHSRSLSEVTSATAREFQSGQSSTKAESTAEQGGVGFGLEIGPVAIGGSGAVSTNTTEVMSASSSFGARDLAANYAQDINDRSQQNASSVRNRRASIVREVSQSEHEQISTRVLTNYNHMHALSVHYYEVVQAFRTTTQLERAERCLFVPVKLVDFRHAETVDRWRLLLAGAALTERARRQLTVEYGVVEIIPQTPRITPGSLVVSGIFDAHIATGGIKTMASFASAAAARSASTDEGSGGASTPATEGPPTTPPPATPPNPTNTDYRRAPVNAPAALLALKGWDIEQLNRVGWATGRVLMQAGSDSVFVSDDALVVGFSLRDGQAARFVVRLHTGQEVTPAVATETAFTFHAPLAITEVESIAVQFTGQQDLKTALVLQLNLFGTVMPLDVPIVLKPMSVPREVVKFGSVRGARELVDHLEANRLHYTQAILRALDAATVAALLARFTYRGLPLGQLVDPQPIAVMANFLVFKMNIATGGEADDPRWADEQKAWQYWLERRGLDSPVPRTEIIPLPSGGLFAEAVLGRYNSAEKTDLTRFWNWQDSPIPISAPEIAPVQAGSRAQSDEIKPGQLSAPVLSIQAPTALPDPTGIAAIINAIQNGNMFRDMSGLAQTLALAQSALQASAAGATAVGEQAGQNLKTVMDNNTERLRIAAQVATGGASGLAGGGGGGGTGSRPAKNVTEEGARLNYARGLDASSASGGSAAGGASGSGGTSGGVIDASSPQFGRSAEVAQPSIERSLFDRQTGGVAANFANQVADAARADDSGGGGGGAAISSISPFSEKLYPTEMTPVDAHNARLSAAMQTVRSTLSDDNKTRLDNISIIVVKLVPRPGVLEYAGVKETDMFFSASLLKASLLYTSFELVARVNKLAPLITAGSANDFFAKVKQDFDGKVANAVPQITPGPWRKVQFDGALTATANASGVFSVTMSDRHLQDLDSIFSNQNQNTGARECIRRLGFSYHNGALAAAGFLGLVTEHGIWLASDFISDDPPAPGNWRSFHVPVSTNGTSSVAMTSLSMAQLLTKIGRMELFDDPASNQAIRSIYAKGGAWLSQLANQGSFSFISKGAKVGHSSSATAKVGSVMSEAAFLERKSDGAAFVAVWQNVPDPLGSEPIYRVIDEVVKNWP
jgi:hypothetical protein